MLGGSFSHVYVLVCPNSKVKMLTKHALTFATSFMHSIHSESCTIDQSILWIEFALNLSFEYALLYCYPSLICSDSSYQL